MYAFKPIILIVNDRSNVVFDLIEILKQAGYNAINCKTSFDYVKEAIQFYSPSLIILDGNLDNNEVGVDIINYVLSIKKTPYLFIPDLFIKSTSKIVKVNTNKGFIINPFKYDYVKSIVDSVINNYQHKNDIISKKALETIDNVPFIIKNALKFIDNNIHKNIKLADVAKQTQWKSQHFNKLVNQYLGISVHKYITIKKIEKSISMLVETNLSVSDVATEFGFKSVSNFTFIFKRITGKTPNHFRIWYNINNRPAKLYAQRKANY